MRHDAEKMTDDRAELTRAKQIKDVPPRRVDQLLLNQNRGGHRAVRLVVWRCSELPGVSGFCART